MATTNEVTIHNKLGLHARPAALFVKTAASFSASITVENLTKKTKPVNAKSIIGLLTGAVQQNDHIRISAEGTDEEEAVARLSALIASNFGEAE